jgi:hypothetical protein
MKITVSLTIELDRANWDDGKRIPAEVREDVKAYVLNTVQQSATMQDADARVSVR